MEGRQSEFSEERVVKALNVIDDKIRGYLRDNNMIENFNPYPNEDLLRIITTEVLDLETLIVLDYAVRNIDLSGFMYRDFSGWFVEWSEFYYSDFEVSLLNRIAEEEKNNLNELIFAKNKHKNNERL
ncbi:hypothetical protein ACR71Z_27745 (plasmid) [Klebsiella pneumoniae]